MLTFARFFYSIDATATAGLDYTPVNGTLTFAAGETNRTIVVPILNDGLVEGVERFQVLLTNATSETVFGSLKVATVTIQDNDRGPQFELASYSANEDVGEDYLETAGTLTFQPDETVKRVTIPLLNDAVPEAGERLELVLSNPVGFQRLAETRGFLLCYPEGVFDRQGWRFWDATEACCDFYGAEGDDSTYLRGVIEEVAGLFAVDRKRIHVTGYSNGGFMSHRIDDQRGDA